MLSKKLLGKKIKFLMDSFHFIPDYVYKAQNILILQIVFFGISLFSNWNLQYFDRNGNANLIPKVSFQVDDPPYMPSGSNPNRILGFHYFGDWTMGLDYGRTSNPFIIEEWPSQTPPIGVIFFRLMGQLGTSLSYFLILITSFYLFLFCINKFLKKLSTLEKTILVLIYFFSLPSVVSYDRGSLYLFIYSLILYTYYLYDSDRKIFAGLLFIFICSLKPQYSILLLFLLLKGGYISSFKIIFYTISSNSIAFFFFPGQLERTFRGYVSATQSYASSELSGLIMQSTSIVGLISRQYERFIGPNSGTYWLENNSRLLLIPGLVWIIFISFLIRYTALTQKSSLLLLLSTLSLVVPTSMNYTLGWAGLGLVVSLLPRDVEFFPKSRLVRFDFPLKFTDIYLLVVLSISLAPIFIQYHNGQMPISIQRDATTLLMLLLPIIIAVEILITFVFKRFRLREEKVL